MCDCGTVGAVVFRTPGAQDALGAARTEVIYRL